ncbi:MAG: response regulator [Anaerolineales bacterium]
MKSGPLILLVNSNPRNIELLEQFLKKAGYEISGTTTLEEASQFLEGAKTPDLALVDITGFDQHIWTFCDALHSREVPFLLISPRYSSALQQESIARGARGMLVKPLATRELLALIKTMINQE